MPVVKIAHALSSIIGVLIVDHPDITFFVGKGFRMRIKRIFPLTISIMHINGVVHSEEWTFLPHLARANKPVIREPSVN